MSQVPERITCEVFRVNRDLSIKHQVTLGKKSISDGRRRGPMSAFTYNSNKYSNVKELTSYTLDTEDYLIIEKVAQSKEQEKVQILMSYQHIFKLKNALKEVRKWFYNDEYAELFIYIDDVPRVNVEMQVSAAAFGLVGGKAVMFRPAVVEIETEYFEGCSLHLNDEECVIYLTLDQFEALMDFVMNFRLYEASRLLLNTLQGMVDIEIEERKSTGGGFNSYNGPVKNNNLKPSNRKLVVGKDIDIEI